MLEELVKYLLKSNEKSAAITLLDALYRNAYGYRQYDDVAKCFFILKEYFKSLDATLKALDSANNEEEKEAAKANLVNIYNHANYPELALPLIEEIEKKEPLNIDNILEKSYAYFLLNEKDKAEELLHYVLTTFSDISEQSKIKIKFNLGTYYLYRDEFQKGLRFFMLEGSKLDFWHKQNLEGYTFWEGCISIGMNLILYAEAGIGDEIISVRFMRYLKDYGINAIWYTDRKDLVAIFNQNGFPATSDKSQLPTTGYWTYPMRLPIYLNLQYKDLWYGPYLQANQEYENKYYFLQSNKPSIGIRWQGNPDYDQDLHRSIPLKEIYEITQDIDAEFYSLQRDIGLDQLNDFPDIMPLHEYMETFEDTLGIIANLDIVITSCTSIAHAAAAMGKETLVLVPISAYYTWSHSCEQSPWYGDNVKLFRQEKPRSWQEPLEKLYKYLGTRL